MISVIGRMVARGGHVRQVDRAGDVNPYVLAPESYLRRQPAGLKLHIDHDTTWPIGEVVHLERSNSGIMMMGRVHDDLASLLRDHQWWLSDSVTCRRRGVIEYGSATLTEISLVGRTANMCTPPIRWSPSDIAVHDGGAPWGLPLAWHGTWHRAHERLVGAKYKRAAATLDILDLDPLGIVDEVLTDPEAARQRVEAAARRAAPAAAQPDDESRVYRHHAGGKVVSYT
jgi:hypothetical protein